jgi:exosortase/archaeosortase family protein
VKIIASTVSSLKTLPVLVRLFLIKAITIFVIWKLLYLTLLHPLRVPDSQLTHLTAYSTAEVYSVFNKNTIVSIREELKEKQLLSVIYVDGKRAVGIADSCNGLELYILYLGYLFCINTRRKRLFAFSMIGIVGIFVLNTFRCYGLCLMSLSNSSFTDFAHHYFFKIIIYGAIFFTWVQYSKSYFKDDPAVLG